MTEVNSDLSPCALAIHQAVGIWTLQSAHELTPADRASTPGLLSDDQTACSLTSESIYDLANIDIPGPAAGKHLSQMVAAALLWSTSDALRVIEDVVTLLGSPNDTSARADLTKAEASLGTDRAQAIAQERAADRAAAPERRRPPLPGPFPRRAPALKRSLIPPPAPGPRAPRRAPHSASCCRGRRRYRGAAHWRSAPRRLC